MKRLYLGLVLILLFATINSTNAQKSDKQLWYCWEETVHPQHIEEYFELGKELAELCKKEGAKYTFYAWTTGDFKYQYWHPIESLNDIDASDKEWQEILTKFGKEKTARWNKTIKSTNIRTVTEMAHLSIVPENPRVPADSINFVSSQEFYLLPGTEAEFERIMGEATKYLKSKGHQDIWRVAYAGIGFNGPMYMGWAFDKNQIDYLKHDEEFTKEHSEFFKGINKDFIKILDSIKKKDSWYIRDLSYFN